MKIHLLSGFLGSGKTTAIQKAFRILLNEGVKTGVITNDQGTKLVDGDFFNSLGIPGRQVTDGCFCCNYGDLDAGITSLAETSGAEVIFAESVGSCTDIVATVYKPLLHFRPGTRVTLSVFADIRLLQMMLDGNHSFDDRLRYIYLKQLEEAGIIVINKVDLVDSETLNSVKSLLQEKYGGRRLLYQNSLDELDIREWLYAVNHYPATLVPESLQINYDEYAAGEAALAWADHIVEIYSPGDNALQAAEELVNGIYKKVKELRFPLGHLKFLVNNNNKISFTGSSDPAVSIKKTAAAAATVLVNIRVQAKPEQLTALVENAVRETALQTGCTLTVSSHAAFQPGYPRPVHRM